MGDRWYDPAIGRWLSPDVIIPDPTNPQSLNRYSYALNNPVINRDGSGHCVDGLTTVACLAIGAAIVMKAIDYGWTAYDTWQSGRTLADPNASQGEKMMAGLNVGMAVLFEAIEPDDFLPASLPLDDAARKGVMNGAQEAYKAGGDEALEKYIRDNLGEHADEVLEKVGLGSKRARIDFRDEAAIGHIFQGKHNLPDTPDNRNLILDVANNPNNFLGADGRGNEWYHMIQDNGTQVWVQVRNGKIFNGGINDIPRQWNPQTGFSYK